MLSYGCGNSHIFSQSDTMVCGLCGIWIFSSDLYWWRFTLRFKYFIGPSRKTQHENADHEVHPVKKRPAVQKPFFPQHRVKMMYEFSDAFDKNDRFCFHIAGRNLHYFGDLAKHAYQTTRQISHGLKLKHISLCQVLLNFTNRVSIKSRSATPGHFSKALRRWTKIVERE